MPLLLAMLWPFSFLARSIFSHYIYWPCLYFLAVPSFSPGLLIIAMLTLHAFHHFTSLAVPFLWPCHNFGWFNFWPCLWPCSFLAVVFYGCCFLWSLSFFTNIYFGHDFIISRGLSPFSLSCHAFILWPCFYFLLCLSLVFGQNFFYTQLTY